MLSSLALDRVFRRHGVSVAMKPHQTLKRLLVHPKDKRKPHDTAGVVYQIPCKDCPKVYTGETGRRYGERVKEHITDVDSVKEKKFTRLRKKESESEYHPSAMTDHVAQNNHTINWDKVTFPTKEPHWTTRGIREAIHIKLSRPHAMNRDKGRHQLPDVYNLVLPAAPPTGCREH